MTWRTPKKECEYNRFFRPISLLHSLTFATGIRIAGNIPPEKVHILQEVDAVGINIEISIMIKSFFYFLIFVLITSVTITVQAQVQAPVEQVNGKNYYMHLVQKGQTLYSL